MTFGTYCVPVLFKYRSELVGGWKWKCIVLLSFPATKIKCLAKKLQGKRVWLAQISRLPSIVEKMSRCLQLDSWSHPIHSHHQSNEITSPCWSSVCPFLLIQCRAHPRRGYHPHVGCVLPFLLIQWRKFLSGQPDLDGFPIATPFPSDSRLFRVDRSSHHRYEFRWPILEQCDGRAKNGRLPSVDGRLLSVDGRLPSVDGRLPSVDGRLRLVANEVFWYKWP